VNTETFNKLPLEEKAGVIEHDGPAGASVRSCQAKKANANPNRFSPKLKRFFYVKNYLL
jgi:hypothetical protein